MIASFPFYDVFLLSLFKSCHQPALADGCPVPDLSPHGLSPPRYNEINAISTACSYGITECQDLATDYLRQWQQNVTNNP